MTVKKIEIIKWFQCNCRCVFCASRKMRGGEFSLEEIVRLLVEHKSYGAEAVDFGGGEPTIGDDLPAMAAAARRIGYKKIGVKSNGMRFCYPDYARLCMDSGINEFSISLWGHSPEIHDNLAGRAGAFEMTEMGLKHLVDFGADVCVDFLLTAMSVDYLIEALKKLEAIGVRKYRLWLFSLFGAGGEYGELMPALKAAGAAAVRASEAMKGCFDYEGTTHIMPCFLKGRESMYHNIKDMDLLIITRGNSFRAEESLFEAGSHIAACEGCRFERGCAGPRMEYLKFYGESEFKKVK